MHEYVDSNAVNRLVTDLRFEDPRVPSPRLMIIKVRGSRYGLRNSFFFLLTLESNHSDPRSHGVYLAQNVLVEDDTTNDACAIISLVAVVQFRPSGMCFLVS